MKGEVRYLVQVLADGGRTVRTLATSMQAGAV